MDHRHHEGGPSIFSETRIQEQISSGLFLFKDYKSRSQTHQLALVTL
ncbi:hypothetical protein [Pseudomonas viridiflava]|nr:hypothetical protein [Pseudomonas viridiflava]